MKTAAGVPPFSFVQYRLLFRFDALNPIVLDAGRAQSPKPEAIYCALPAGKFLDRKIVTPASVFQADQAATYGSDEVRFLADNPTRIVSTREIRQGQWAAVYGLYVAYFCLMHHLAPFRDASSGFSRIRATRCETMRGKGRCHRLPAKRCNRTEAPFPVAASRPVA